MTIPSPDGQRLPPAGPPGAYKSYTILRPLSTHWRIAGCSEAGCANHRNGFMVRVDETTELGQRQAHFIRHDRTRTHTEDREAGLTVFTFPAGTECFARTSGKPHRIPNDRPERYFTRPGDWRGDPTGGRPYEHTRPDFWVEDFAENQDRIQRIIDRG